MKSNGKKTIAIPWDCKTFANPRDCKAFATIFYVKSKIALENATFYVKLQLFVYLANHVKILLHDHFSGCIEIANPSGYFSSLGASPLGMKLVPWDLQFQCIPQNDRAIYFCCMRFTKLQLHLAPLFDS